MRIEHNEEYDSYYSFVDKSDSFQHFGRPGQKWYQRLYQYKDGSLTPLGRIRYGVGPKRNKEMKSKSYTTSDYEGFHAYKKNRKYSSYKGKGDRLKKKASDAYNEDIVTDMAKNKALKDLGKDAYFSDKKVLGVFKKLDKEKVQNLSDQYANSEEFRKIKAYLDARKDDVIDISKEKKENTSESEKLADKNDEQLIKESGDSYDVEKIAKEISDVIDKYGDESDYYEGITKEIESDLKRNKIEMETDHDGYTRRKDGKPFSAKVNGVKIERDNLEDLIDEIMVANNHKKLKDTQEETYRILDEKESRLKDINVLMDRVSSLKKSGYTAEEIAKKMNIPVGTVNSYLYSRSV